MAPHLPDELLLHIFSYLISWKEHTLRDYGHYEELDETGLKALVSLCKSCRHFRFLAEPTLYSVFVKPANQFHLSTPFKLPKHTFHQPSSTLRKYLRTLIERPDLADGVKRLQIYAWESSATLEWEAEFDEELTLITLSPSSSLASSFFETASNLLPPGAARTEWIIALCRGDEDAEVALLLALLPNVEMLQVALPDRCESGHYHSLFFNRVIQQAIGRKQPSRMHDFSRLKRLDARHSTWDSVSGLPIYPFSDFFQLPQLEVFNGHRMSPAADPDEGGGWLCPKGVSRIQDLHLHDSVMSSETIALLVASCLSLRSLKVWGRRCYEGFETLGFEWPDLGEALKRHKSSLQILSVDIYADTNLWPSEAGLPPAPMLDSLKEFTALRRVEIQQSALVGGYRSDGHYNLLDILPPSLEHLVVLNTDHIMESHLESLSKDVSRLPKLQKIGVGSCKEGSIRHLAKDDRPEHNRRTGPIREAFEAAGLEWAELYRDNLDVDGYSGFKEIDDIDDIDEIVYRQS